MKPSAVVFYYQSPLVYTHNSTKNIVQVNCINVLKDVDVKVIPMGCPPVRGDNPRALASGLSYVQVDKHDLTILYHNPQCRPCTSRDMSC